MNDQILTRTLIQDLVMSIADIQHNSSGYNAELVANRLARGIAFLDGKELPDRKASIGSGEWLSQHAIDALEAAYDAEDDEIYPTIGC